MKWLLFQFFQVLVQGLLQMIKKLILFHLLNKDGTESILKVDGVFILIGVLPNNEMLPLDILKADDGGFIPTDLETRTAVAGVYAAGDIRSKEVRQVINAAGEGATAVLAAENYLINLS